MQAEFRRQTSRLSVISPRVPHSRKRSGVEGSGNCASWWDFKHSQFRSTAHLRGIGSLGFGKYLNSLTDTTESSLNNANMVQGVDRNRISWMQASSSS